MQCQVLFQQKTFNESLQLTSIFKDFDKNVFVFVVCYDAAAYEPGKNGGAVSLDSGVAVLWSSISEVVIVGAVGARAPTQI